MSKTPEEILKEFANEHSYESWYELMYDTHEKCQLEYTIEAMMIFAKNSFEAAKETDIVGGYFLSKVQKYESFEEWIDNVRNDKNDNK